MLLESQRVLEFAGGTDSLLKFNDHQNAETTQRDAHPRPFQAHPFVSNVDSAAALSHQTPHDLDGPD